MVPGFWTFVRCPCSATRNGGDTDSPAALFRATMLTTPLTCFSDVRHSFERLVTIYLCSIVLTITSYVCSCGDRHLVCSFTLFTLIVLNSIIRSFNSYVYIADVHCRAVLYYITRSYYHSLR